MATIKVRWFVDELANVMSLFDTQKVYRSTVGEPYSWVEITAAPTRVDLVAGVTEYLFDDVAGDESYYYAMSYYNSTTTEESGLSDPIRGELSGYITIAEIRDEGVTSTMVGDDGVARGIERATQMIDQVTGLWFEPRARTFRLDSQRGAALRLNVPIIAVTSMEILDEEVDTDDLWIYNRHLTQGLLNPDDRRNPIIVWREDDLPRSGDVIRYERRFHRGPMRVELGGIFGWTDLPRAETPGETTPGSQVPNSYGVTPELIKLACLRLTMKYMYPLVTGEGDEFAIASRIVEERTRDQAYKLAQNGDASDGSWGLTGDMEVDTILSGFMAPAAIGIV